ncbi:hypothetical protein RhiirA5_426816 [Rhizophagus irregularis]|uniref:Uncharacterized protein n=1 Tax=Rhizophagus irregularis TaxID=588596 RepID=A0A2N0P3H4_9GLOM|nr:hypothetical protein RhiirA5_426816 [Rhizophagus irregularis]
MSFSLQVLKLSSSFRFLGVWFNLQGSPNFVLSQLKDIYSSFVVSVRFKKLSPAQLAYLHLSVVLPKVQFRSQVLYLSESQVMRIASSYYGLQRKALSVARTFPSIALISKFFSKDSNPYDSLYFSLWTSKRRSISHNWLFQAIKLLHKSGLQFDFPDHTFIELMPNKACPLCLSQVVDPFYNFRYTWNNLKLMGLIAPTGKTPSWFQIITSLSNPTSYLPKRIESINITPSLSSLVGKFVDTIDTSSYIRLRNKYYWIAEVDFSGSLIFGQITPCPGCFLHCLDMDEGPLALKTVGGKLIHRSCLSVLPFYRCLQLYQMTIHIDISQQFINLKLSLFILCSYFRFLLGFSELYIPERYLALTQPPLMHCDTSPALLPDLTTPISSPAFALRPDTKFHLSGTIHVVDSLTSLLVCA